MAHHTHSCTEKDPCFCIQSCDLPKPVAAPCPAKNKCCVIACNAILNCNDSVGPCGQVGIFDLSQLSHTTTGCEGKVQFTLEQYDENIFEDVCISKDGKVTWTTKGAETVNKYGEVCFGIQCAANCNDCAILSSLGYLQIGVDDLCKNIVCDEKGTNCDPCSGKCTKPVLESDNRSSRIVPDIEDNVSGENNDLSIVINV